MAAAEGLYTTFIINCAFNAFSSYTAIAFNIIAIQAMRKTPLPTPLKTLLMNLAFSDLGVGLLAQPMYVASLFLKAMKLNTDNYLFNIVSVVVVNILSFASFFFVTAVSADRFLAIHLHLRYQELVTLKRVVSAVISIWVLSAIFSLLFSFIPEMAFLVKVSLTACFISTTFFYV